MTMQSVFAGMRLVEVSGHEERYLLLAPVSAEQLQADCGEAVAAIRARPDDGDEPNYLGCPWVSASEIVPWLIKHKDYIELRAGDPAFRWFDHAHQDQPETNDGNGVEGAP